MSANENLRNAKKAKNDEFYTMLSDIENELKHYRDHFKGKVIYCNCDNPEWSNFWNYFYLNFEPLGLKKLIATFYDKENPVYKAEYDGKEVVKTPLEGNGDFRSAECIECLEEADIVVTNPPFSLWRIFINQLVEHNKKFILLGNMNAVTYKEFFPLLKDNKVWPGFSFNKTMEFIMPDDYVLKGKAYIDDKGKKHGFVPAIAWFTNLDIQKRHEELILYKRYNPEEYPKYDNYDAIEVSRTVDIPMDYEGVMGAPISWLDHYCPEQFEIVGLAPERNGETGAIYQIKFYKGGVQHKKDGTTCPGSKVNDGPTVIYDKIPDKFPWYTASNVEGYLEVKYARILIRHKHPRKD